jgi:hypothetical protein
MELKGEKKKNKERKKGKRENRKKATYNSAPQNHLMCKDVEPTRAQQTRIGGM